MICHPERSEGSAVRGNMQIPRFARGDKPDEWFLTMNAISLTWQPEGAFHHVGFVVASIPNSVQGFASMLQADWDEQVFHDPNQGVRVTFLKSRRAGNPFWKWLEPADKHSPLFSLAARGVGLHKVVKLLTIWSRRS